MSAATVLAGRVRLLREVEGGWEDMGEWAAVGEALRAAPEGGYAIRAASDPRAVLFVRCSGPRLLTTPLALVRPVGEASNG